MARATTKTASKGAVRFKNILFATDGSKSCNKILNEVIAFAKTLNAVVTGVHVIPVHCAAVIYGYSFWTNDEIERELQASVRKHADAYLDRVEAAAKSARVKFQRTLVKNDAVSEGIVNTANKKHADLIVMAAHGGRGIGLLLGSQTHKVLTHSKIPVLVYR